jgi:superfamily II DNA or RNA helicase
MILLRDYQQKIEVKTFEKIQEEIKEIIITTSMGGGKTIIIASIIDKIIKNNNENIFLNIVILLNIVDILPQLIKTIEEFNLNININVLHSNNHKITKDVYNKNAKYTIWIILEQTFSNMMKQYKESELLGELDNIEDLENIENDLYTNKKLSKELVNFLTKEYLKDNCSYLMKDEYHIGHKQKRFDNLIDFFNPKNIIGLTGTPIKENGYLLDGITDKNIINYGTALELTLKGYLVPLKYLVPLWAQKQDYSKLSISGNDYSTKEIEAKINTELHNNLVVKSIIEVNKDKTKKTMVYCNSIAHAENINKILLKNGFKSASVHSKNKREYNEDILSRYTLNKEEENSINVITSIGKLTTGYDNPDMELLVLVRPTKILRLYLQIIFRVARPNGIKKYGEVLDLSKSLSTHGFATDIFKFQTQPEKNKKKSKEEKELEELVSLIKEEAILEILNKNEKNELVSSNINAEDLNVKIKELKQQKIETKKMKNKNLFNFFYNSADIELIVLISIELNKRINGKTILEENDVYYINKIKGLLELSDDISLGDVEVFNKLEKIKEKISFNIRNKKENIFDI